MEPILLREATVRGVITNFNTEFQLFIQDTDGITTTVKDIISNNVYQIRSKFLVGCDGGRSEIAKQLQIPMLTQPGQGIAINM